MSKKTIELKSGEMGEPTVDWRDVPTVLIDSIVGFVVVGGVPRITLGTVNFSPNVSEPVYKPTITIAAPFEALKYLSVQIAEIVQGIEGEQIEEATHEGSDQ